MPARLPSGPWRRRRSPSTSSCRSSGPGSTGSVSTFDPAALERRVGELEAAMGEPGFWDDQARAAQTSAEHARASRRLERYTKLAADYDDARGAVRARSGDGRRDRLGARADPPRARPARGGGALQRRVRPRRRGRHDPVRRGRHRRAGLGRDAPAHVPALGRRPRLQGGPHRGAPGGGGRAQVRDLHRPRRERLRDPQGRARRPPPRPPAPVRPGAPPPDELRPGRSSRRSSPTTPRSRSTRTTSGSTRTARRAPAAST